MQNFSTLGAELGMMLALMDQAKRHKPRPPTPQELEQAQKRAELQRWNEDVAQRKALKKRNKQAGA